MSLIIPGKGTVVDVGPKKYEQYGPLNLQQVAEIKTQINAGLQMGVPPEQPVSMPTIAIVGLLRLVDTLLEKSEQSKDFQDLKQALNEQTSSNDAKESSDES